MKIVIIGGGNMGGAIAQGLASGSYIQAKDITVVNKNRHISYGTEIQSLTSDYSSLSSATIIILAIKPWMVKDFLKEHQDKFTNKDQLIISVASGITLADLSDNLPYQKPIFRLMPNTAISEKESMTFISSLNTNHEQKELVTKLFSELGKVEIIDEKLFSAATAISGCGIAYAFRYIRASVQAGVEMGMSVKQSQFAVMQAMKGAITLLEANQSSPEEEIDKVTTPGGITIKGLNAMEEAGFSTAIIKGLKASNIR